MDTLASLAAARSASSWSRCAGAPSRRGTPAQMRSLLSRFSRNQLIGMGVVGVVALGGLGAVLLHGRRRRRRGGADVHHLDDRGHDHDHRCACTDVAADRLAPRRSGPGRQAGPGRQDRQRPARPGPGGAAAGGDQPGRRRVRGGRRGQRDPLRVRCSTPLTPIRSGPSAQLAPPTCSSWRRSTSPSSPGQGPTPTLPGRCVRRHLSTWATTPPRTSTTATTADPRPTTSSPPRPHCGARHRPRTGRRHRSSPTAPRGPRPQEADPYREWGSSSAMAPAARQSTSRGMAEAGRARRWARPTSTQQVPASRRRTSSFSSRPIVEVQCCDAAGFPILEAQLVGQGDAWIFTGGQLVEAKWSRPAADKPTVYTDAARKPVGLTPGRTWVALAPPGTATLR